MNPTTTTPNTTTPNTTTPNTTTPNTTTPNTTTPNKSCTVVDRFLDAVRSGEFASHDDIYTAASMLDMVVPGWRFAVKGDEAIGDEYARWFAAPGEFEELRRLPTEHGEVVEYTLSWVESGVPHGARHVHVFDVDVEGDRIVSDHVWCGGRWSAALLAEMGAQSTQSVAQ